MKCPRCGEDIDGDYLGNHGVLEYQCECGEYWTGDFGDEIDRVMMQYEQWTSRRERRER